MRFNRMSGGHGYARQPKETILHGMMQNNNCSYMCFDTQFPSHQKAGDSQIFTEFKNYFQTSYFWWLIEYPNGRFCLFAPKFWEGGGDVPMIVCRSVSAVSESGW